MAKLETTLAVKELLDVSIIKLDDGFVEYKEGLSDYIIGDRCGCSHSSVKNIRRRLFGILRKDPRSYWGKNSGLKKIAIETELYNLRTAQDEFRMRSDRMYTQLDNSLRRIDDMFTELANLKKDALEFRRPLRELKKDSEALATRLSAIEGGNNDEVST